MPFRGKWLTWSDSDIERWRNGTESSRKYAIELRRVYRMFVRNRLSFFLPHCEGTDFINDRTNDLVMLTKSNQIGGTCHGAVFSLLHTIKCDPTWMIFTHHGIDYHEFEGPKRWLVATTIWEIMADSVWPEYLKLLPRYELGQYAPGYGDPDLYPEEAKTGLPPKELTFRDGRTKQIKLQSSGTIFIFNAYSQAQAVFESRQYDGGHLDEQMKEKQFDGYDERGRTRKNWQSCFTLTGHKIKGRQDTGKGQWMHKKLFLGTDTKGHTIGRYKLWPEGVPEAIFPEESKKKAYIKWVVNPKKNNDMRAMREGEARWFGGWESSDAMVLSNWNERLHLVPSDIPIEKDWTKYRGIDHGIIQPTAVLWLAITPWGDKIFYREYYESGLVISRHCENIMRLCGNKRLKIDSYFDDEIKSDIQLYAEEFSNEVYFSSVLDAHSYNSRSHERHKLLGQLYNDYGLSCTPAKSESFSLVIPKMQAWLEYDKDRPHLMHELWKRKLISDERYKRWLSLHENNYKGGCECYVLDNLFHLQSEITSWQINEETDKPITKDDHLMACFRYLVSEQPVYFGDKWNEVFDDNEFTREERTGTRYTGYG